MAVQSRQYHKVPKKQLAASVKKVTPENRYWTTFQPKFKNNLHGKVPFVRFCRSEPYEAVTCSNIEIRVFRSATMEPYKLQSIKRQHPLCADIRDDTKVIAVGGMRGKFVIYNNAKPSGLDVLRNNLRGHKGDIRDIMFQPLESTKIATVADDQFAGYWDMVSEKRVLTIKSHSDYVRAVDWMWSEPTCFATGSYDHTVKLWDSRDCPFSKTGDTVDMATPKQQWAHKYPVEAIHSIPNSDLIAIAGGPSVMVWSLRKMSAPLFDLDIHLKSVTSLTTNSTGSRLLTGSMDKFVRVFRVNGGKNSGSTMENVHSFPVPSGVLSISMSNNDKRLAIGTNRSGLITRARGDGMDDLDRWNKIQQYEYDPLAKYDDDVREFMDNRQKLRYMSNEAQAMGKEKYIRYGSRDWALRGQSLKLPPKINFEDLKPRTKDLQVDNVGWNLTVVRKKRWRPHKGYDSAFRSFQYRKALDLALKSKDVLTVHSVLEELWRRDGLMIAFGGRNSQELRPLLEYLVYSLGHPHLAQTALHCTALLVDSYQSIIGLSDDTDFLFKKVAEIIDHQVAVQKILLKVQGSVDMILSAQDIAANPVPQRMLNLRERINEMRERTRKLYESKKSEATNGVEGNGHANGVATDRLDSVTPDSMDLDS